MLKTASAYLINETITGKYGQFKAYLAKGDTFPIKDLLKNLGFTWSPSRGLWWISERKTTPAIIDQLKKHNVEIKTDDTANSQQSETSKRKEAPKAEPQSEQKTEQKTWKTDAGTEDLEKWYKFPINKNILSFTLDFELDGEKHSEPVTIERTCVFSDKDIYNKKKSREYVGLPRYVIKVGNKTVDVPFTDKKEEAPIGKISYTSKEKWGTYNENELLEKLKTLLKQKLENNPKQEKVHAIHNSLLINYDNQKRSPEFVEFINKMAESKDKFEGEDLGITTTITSDKYPKYNGTYKTKVELYDKNTTKVAIYTNVSAKDVPRKAYLIEVRLYKIHTIEAFKKKLQEFANSSKAQENYLQYLQSFPFLKEEKETSNKEAETINQEIRSGDYESIIKKMKNMGYVRPSLKQKATTEDKIKWVMDSKKIYEDFLGDTLTNSPLFFYTAISYYIYKQKIGAFSWQDFKVTSFYSWLKNMEELGLKFDQNTVFNEINLISEKIIASLFSEEQKRKEEKKEKHRQEQEQKYKEYQEQREQERRRQRNYWDGQYQNRDQYQNNYQNRNQYQRPNMNRNYLEEFSTIAKKYNLNTDNITSNLKSVYRSLVNLIHPDKFPDPIKKSEKTEEFKQLQGIWDKIKLQYQVASNWYDGYLEKFG